MKYKISNDPNYEENEKMRQIQKEKEWQEKNQAYQQMLMRISNKYLDKIQYAIDNRKYKVSITGKLWNKRKVIEIVLGNSTFGKADADLKCIEIMDNVAKCIQLKFPQWEVVGYYSDTFRNTGNGNYGIRIICDMNDFV